MMTRPQAVIIERLPTYGVLQMATYRQIQNDIRARYGTVVKTCWIAHVKELNGLPRRTASNRRSRNVREVLCPVSMRPAIEESFRRFGMI